MERDSKWAINIKGATINGKDFFKKFAVNDCPAVIATASSTIKIPPTDFD
jgi:hypothetical protein